MTPVIIDHNQPSGYVDRDPNAILEDRRADANRRIRDAKDCVSDERFDWTRLQCVPVWGAQTVRIIGTLELWIGGVPDGMEMLELVRSLRDLADLLEQHT